MTPGSSIQTQTLSCGATLLIEPMADVQSAAFSILVPAGTIYEPPGVNGAAAVLTDLVTRGAGPYDSRSLHAELDRLGAQCSESTGWNFISFSGALLPGHLQATFDIYAEILQRAHLPPRELAPALIGVEQSLRSVEDEPQRKVFVEVRRSCFDDPWGRPTDGTLDELPRITPAVIQQLFDDGFRPDGTIIGVAGRVDADRIRAQLDRSFEPWQPGPPRTIQPGPRPSAVRHIHHDSAQTHIGLAWESVPFGHDDYYAAWAAASILGGASSARLFTEVREYRGLCYSVSSSLTSVLNAGRVVTYVGTTADRAQETLDVTLQEIDKLAAGVRADELERCQANAKSSLVMQQESTSARAAALARDWFYLGRVQTLQEVREQVESLTVDRVNNYLARHRGGDFTVVTIGREPLEIRPSSGPATAS